MNTAMETKNQGTTRSFFSAISAGVIASLVDTIIFTAARTVGLTSYNKEFLVAKAWLGLARNPAVWLLGLILSLMLGGLIGWLYSLGFKAARDRLLPGWDTGIAFGVIHWLIAGAMLGYFASAGNAVDSPGYFGVDMGWPTFGLLFLTHLLFGAIVGGLYLPPARAAHVDTEESILFGDDNEPIEDFEQKAS